MEYNENEQRQLLLSATVTLALAAANVLIFALCYFNGTDVYGRFALDSEAIAQGRDYYRLVSSIFLHASIDHLFSNMLILVFIGANVEHDLGHIAYLVLFFLTGIAGNIVSVIVDFREGAYSLSVGASGADFGIIGAVIVIVFFGRKYLRQRGSTLIVRVALMVVFSVYSGFTANDINNAAHIGGLAGGVIYTLLITLICHKSYTSENSFLLKN